jgi:hypothetical protein
VNSLIASFKNFDRNLTVLPVSFKACVVTKELLCALLCLGTLELRNEEHRARIQSVTTFMRLTNALSAKAALILEFFGINRGHTI